jgi:hypothetical protein
VGGSVLIGVDHRGGWLVGYERAASRKVEVGIEREKGDDGDQE